MEGDNSFHGSAPNLIQYAKDKHGVLQMQRAFNTQVDIVLLIYFLQLTCLIRSEQLNGWIGGFESILKRMMPGKFIALLKKLVKAEIVLRKLWLGASLESELSSARAGPSRLLAWL